MNSRNLPTSWLSTGNSLERLAAISRDAILVVDDFARLIQAGRDSPLWEGTANKGHADELRLFGESIVNGTPPPIALDEIVETTALALKIEESLR